VGDKLSWVDNVLGIRAADKKGGASSLRGFKGIITEKDLMENFKSGISKLQTLKNCVIVSFDPGSYLFSLLFNLLFTYHS
jgi:hypothetical protein